MKATGLSPAVDVAARLQCPLCGRGVTQEGDGIVCGTCGTVATMRGGVISFNGPENAYFDDRVHELDTTTSNNWAFSYSQQVALLAPFLERAATVLDVGCGSRLAYEPKPGTFVIGVDPSAAALRANSRLNLRVHTSAFRLPVPSASIDLLVCFYSLHHMVGATIAETRANVIECLRECARVVAPAGTLFIVENNPRGLFSTVQRWAWMPAKGVLGKHLDMFFWTPRQLDELLAAATGRVAARTLTFDTDPLTVLSPLFAFPRFKVFRFMHPLNCSVSIWAKETQTMQAPV